VTDMWLIFRNATTYNPAGTPVHKCAKKVADSFRHKLVKAFSTDDDDEHGSGKRRKLDGRERISVTELEKVSKVLDYEYINLRSNMAKLSPDELQKAVIVAQERNVSSVVSTMDTVTLDLDALNPGDFRYLSKYVQSIVS